MSDLPVAAAATDKTNTQNEHPYLQRDLNPRPPAIERMQTYALERIATTNGTSFF
jgi:hypothetical protein